MSKQEEKEEEKKDFIGIGGTSIWILLLDGVIKAAAGFFTLKFLESWWKKSDKSDKKDLNSDE